MISLVSIFTCRKKHRSLYFSVVLAALYFFTFSLNAQVIILKEAQGVSSLGNSLFYYVENEGENYTVEEISSQNLDEKWLQNPTKHLNLGYNPNTVWLKIEIENQSTINDWYLVVDIPFTDEIIFYEPNIEETTTWKTAVTGGKYNYLSRGEIKHSGFAFPLSFQEDQTHTYYLKIKSNYPILLPIFIATKSNVYEDSQNRHLGYGAYFGILWVMILYNLIVFSLTRDFNYLYYIFTIIATFLTFAGVSGYLFKYVYPTSPSVNDWLVRASMSLTVVFTSIFSIHFLQLKSKVPWLFYSFCVSTAIAVVAFILNQLGYQGTVNTAVKIQTLLLLVSGVYCWVKGNKFARFFVLAWAIYIVGGLMITLRNSGTLPINFWTNHGAEIGSALEVILISMALADRYRIIKKEKEIATQKALKLERQTSKELEDKVTERTQRLNESNEELAQTNEELFLTLEVLEQQKSEIEIKNTDISASINYAKRIQEAFLPSKDAIQKAFSDAFTLYLPKDIVSGDFYFFFQNKEYIFLAVADCTGHGVPGSLMSMIGMNLLRENIIEKNITSPSKILMNLHTGISSTLQQEKTGNRDGMDIAICVINKNEEKLCFSGAKNSLIAVEKDTLKEYRGSRFSIGGFIKKEGISFEDQIIEIDGETSYYMFSDGYQDQFGGENNRKFMKKRLKVLLQKNHRQPFEEQKQILKNTIVEWMQKDTSSQTDDILVMGFKI